MGFNIKDSFEKILGKNNAEYSEEERKQRWNKWKELAIKNGDPDLVESWEDQSACESCIHLNKNESWCNLQGLPCTVNPILSFRMGMIGMACMGAGKQTSGQQTIEFDSIF